MAAALRHPILTAALGLMAGAGILLLGILACGGAPGAVPGEPGWEPTGGREFKATSAAHPPLGLSQPQPVRSYVARYPMHPGLSGGYHHAFHIQPPPGTRDSKQPGGCARPSLHRLGGWAEYISLLQKAQERSKPKHAVPGVEEGSH